MADVLNVTAWSETDASNNSATQPTFPEGMEAKALNNGARALQGGVKRFVNQVSATQTSAGTAAIYTLSYTVAPEALYAGQRFTWIAHVACDAAPAVNINTLGAKVLRKVISGVVTDLAALEIGVNAVVDMIYRADLGCFIWINPPPPVVAGVPDASLTSKGIVELATRAEVMAGASTLLVLAPDTYAALNYKGAAIAGDTSIALGDGGYFEITGAVFTCTAITYATASALGRKAVLKFVSAGGILTHGVTLLLPTSANITVAAGDIAEIVLDATGIYRVYNYQRATGNALAVTAQGVSVYKAADTTIATDATVNSDPHLAFTVLAGKTYDLEMLLIVATSSAAGFQFQFDRSVAIGRFRMNVQSAGVSGTGASQAMDDYSDNINMVSAGIQQVHFGKGIVIGGAADSVLTLKWAQGSSAGSNTTLEKESYIKYIERP